MAGYSFHPLKVTAVEPAAEDATCVTVEIPTALRESFAHHAGQYVTVRRTINDRDERRTYSIVTAPGGGTLKLGIRRQTGGLMSGDLAANLRPGDMLEVGTPLGRFRTAVDPDRRFSYVAFAAGSGITPVLSLATDILAREPHSRFTLIYGNRSISHTMFLEETLALKNRYVDRLSLHFVMSREPQQSELLNGRIDAKKVAELARRLVEIESADEYLICGPGDMVDEVRDAIKALNGNAPIRFERFATANSRPLEILTKHPEAPAPQEVLATITVTMDGRRRSFPMSPSDSSVLEAAERAGLELPFSCRSGICATCRARITAGAAVMTHNIALERWETDAGFVLCCQARPTTATLEISYDQK
ncbi:MAG TPA: 2Fe-2S iron-sulfur cluster-binding protein [Steroidobacteraceae bacterium]|jgi:ring-1,2-phenylacetyl-CoA epoxidase subunit PaaE|nr:2Fe-2S iron-sulfur cluster-binding protein [Steroidobacteraceae bacterium]